MSYYPVMVCLPGDTKDVEEALSAVLAPYDETLDVEPYRKYEEGSPEEYWWVQAVHRDAEHLRNGDVPEVRRSALEPEKGVWSNKRGAHVSVEQAKADEIEEWKDDAVWAERLGEHPTWRDVVFHYNAKYYPRNEIIRNEDLTDDPDDSLWYDPEQDRAYRVSTYNPESKWDYWRIGGRWSGYFTAAEMSAELIQPGNHWDGPRAGTLGRLACDGGPKRLLDFEAMRSLAANEADARYDRWEKLIADHGPAKSWSHFTGLVDVGELSIEDARKRYRDQPLIAAVSKLERSDEWIVGWGDCAVEAFTPPREEYVLQARNGAVPAYATVLTSGDWAAPGRMGWFGMSSDGPGERAGYNAEINRYLDLLPDDTILVVVDCHI